MFKVYWGLHCPLSSLGLGDDFLGAGPWQASLGWMSDSMPKKNVRGRCFLRLLWAELAGKVESSLQVKNLHFSLVDREDYYEVNSGRVNSNCRISKLMRRNGVIAFYNDQLFVLCSVLNVSLFNHHSNFLIGSWGYFLKILLEETKCQRGQTLCQVTD